MARMTFVPFAGIISMGVIALAGCGSSSGTIGTFGGVGSTGTTATVGGQNTATPPVARGTATGTATGTAGEGWALSAPNSIFGFPRIQPSTTILDKIQSALAKEAAPLGVSGTQVVSVYDDQTHGLYLLFAGYNGSGFDPARLQAAYHAAPTTTEDGAGNKLVMAKVTIDPGPHGGAAGCDSAMEQTAIATTEGTSCIWMTTTTLGVIATYPNPAHPNVVSEGPDVMGKVMRDLRDQVEHHS